MPVITKEIPPMGRVSEHKSEYSQPLSQSETLDFFLYTSFVSRQKKYEYCVYWDKAELKRGLFGFVVFRKAEFLFERLVVFVSFFCGIARCGQMAAWFFGG